MFDANSVDIRPGAYRRRQWPKNPPDRHCDFEGSLPWRPIFQRDSLRMNAGPMFYSVEREEPVPIAIEDNDAANMA